MRAVADGPSREKLRSLEELNLAYVGDASGVVASYAGARNEELEGSVFEFPVDRLVDRVPGDAATITLETRSLILDGEELRRHVEAAVAVADAFEEATARTPPSG